MERLDSATFWYLPVWSLWRREIVRFLRQRSRVIGALGTPIVFWVLIGSGLGNSFRYQFAANGPAAEMNYLEYSFPGMMALMVLFTAVFSMISVIEDRREGFMQAVLAAPVARSAIVVGKILGSTTLAVGQGLLFLALAPAAGISLGIGSIVAALLVLIVLGIGLSGLGFVIAWSMDSTQGFHAIMNLVLVPMWMLSGALFPPTGALRWMAWLMMINPLTYGVTALRQALYLRVDLAGGSAESAVAISMAFAVAMVLLAARIVAKKG